MRGTSRAVLLVWLLLASVSGALLLRAGLAPPKGTAFVGTFYYVDDFYNYLSSVEQAERGALVFRSKLASPALPPALVNLEWLAVGWLAVLLGGHALLAYRLFGLAVLAGLVALAGRWLDGCGLAPPRRPAALLLVMTGGGLGGVLYAARLLPGERALDLRTGAYPFVEALANPHFVAGTTLLAAALAAFAAGRLALGAAAGFVLALVRPYDAALLLAVEGASVLLDAPVRRWPGRLLAASSVAPPLVYSALVVSRRPGFDVFSSPLYGAFRPAPIDLLVAFGPAAAILLAGLALGAGPRALLAHLRRGPELPRGGDPQRAHRLRLALWLATVAGAVLLHPVAYSLQFLVGVGFPLLVLAAAALASLRRLVLEVASPLMASTAVVAVLLCSQPRPQTHVPIERWRVVAALGRACQPGDLVLAPPDIGLLLGGLTPCWPYVSHPAATDHPARLALVHLFYDPALTPAARASLLERTCAKYVVLPSGLSQDALGTPPAFRPDPSMTDPRRALAVWSRIGPLSCPSSS